MSQFFFDKATRVELGGVDISEFIRSSGPFDLDPWQRDMLTMTMTMNDSTAVFKPQRPRVRLRFRGRWHGPTLLTFFDELFSPRRSPACPAVGYALGVQKEALMPKRNPPTGDPILDALKAERERCGLTLQELAERIGRSTYQSIWNWESGTSDPSLGNLREWAGALGFTVVLAVGVPETQP